MTDHLISHFRSPTTAKYMLLLYLITVCDDSIALFRVGIWLWLNPLCSAPQSNISKWGWKYLTTSDHGEEQSCMLPGEFQVADGGTTIISMVNRKWGEVIPIKRQRKSSAGVEDVTNFRMESVILIKYYKRPLTALGCGQRGRLLNKAPRPFRF